MRRILVLAFAFLVSPVFSPMAYAQVKPGPKKTVTSTYQASGTAEIDDIKVRTKLSRLELAKRDLDLELENIRKARTTQAKNFCADEELNLRQRDAEFAKKHADQIEAIIRDIQGGLQRQRITLRGFENGVAEGAEVVEYINAQGKPDRSAMVEFSAYVDDGKEVRKKVPLKDVIRYVRKFEAEAAKVPEDAAAIEAFLDRYRKPSTQNDPAYFNMTLEQAMKAYTKLLGSVFTATNSEMMGRQLVIGTGKHLFQVRTTTTLGFNPEYGTTVGSTLQAAKAKRVRVELLQDFGVAFKVSEEGRYWDVIRQQQLTIDGIPVDGLKRREYFDGLRSPECVEKVKYSFNQKSEPGPFLSYAQKEECRDRGIEILSASVTSGIDGDDAIFDFTQRVKTAADRQYSFQIDPKALSVPTSLLKEDVVLKVRYRCGCDRRVKEAIKIQTLDMKPTRCGWGCGNAVPEHLVGWAYEEIQSVLTRARAIYGESVILEIITVDQVEGWDPLLAIPTIQQVFKNRGASNHQGEVNRNLKSLRMTHVESLSGEAAAYLFDYRIVIPGDARRGTSEKILSVGRDKSHISCPKD